MEERGVGPARLNPANTQIQLLVLLFVLCKIVNFGVVIIVKIGLHVLPVFM